jgi:alkyldihydroxyacetonephosphate synthase
VRPGDEEAVRAVMSAAVDADAVVIPFGGGTNISGSLEAPTSEARPVISVDLGRMDAVLAVDADSGVARLQPGVFGSHLQQQWTSSSDAVAPFVVEMQ